MLANSATVDVASGASLTFNNQLDLGGNSLDKIGDGTLTVNNILSFGNGGTLNCVVGTCSRAGTVGGNLVNSSGTVAPGNSPGMLTIDGNYDQGSGGTLAIEIGGIQAGVDFDVLNVLGDTSLAGTLSVSLIDGFTPSGGNTFKVLTAGGELTDAGLTLGGSGAASFTMSIDTTNDWITLLAAGTGGGLTGDYSGNGVVDAADYTLFRDNLGADSGVLQNNDIAGVIDVGHYNQWKQNFGTSGTGSSAAVPEPASLVLLLLIGHAAFALRYRSMS